MADMGAVYSLAYAVQAGVAQALEVPLSDLAVTVRQTPASGLPTVVLYDAVPGGAGLVSQLVDEGVLAQAMHLGLEPVGGGMWL
ncbi:MAG: DUF1998 domain-containing protein [Firmicutes bacterium]|nr:DUF1998 domain-containing protein [Bacillota bacterium]